MHSFDGKFFGILKPWLTTVHHQPEMFDLLSNHFMDLKNKVTEINNLISTNKFPQALSKCESLIKKVPNNSYLFNLMGLILQQCNKLNSSIRLLDLIKSRGYSALELK